MSTIRLKSLLHGFTNVYTEADALSLEKSGWSRCEDVPVIPDLVVPESLEAQYEAKFGKKPHHKTNILKALNDNG